MQNEYIKLRAELHNMGAPSDVLFAINDLHTLQCVHRYYLTKHRGDTLQRQLTLVPEQAYAEMELEAA